MGRFGLPWDKLRMGAPAASRAAVSAAIFLMSSVGAFATLATTFTMTATAMCIVKALEVLHTLLQHG